ncbi:MAG: T9SS type A sorting domain-containing protein [Bacteroidales bacterium]|nr:T9SS type A sorting domain-containing protein [Bacteroidales bacterium]
MKKQGTIIIALLAIISELHAQQPAFPGAEGFGKYTSGGRGGMVVYVNNLNDSGTGSLREALTSDTYKGKKRTIVFSVSGTIELQTTIEIKYDSCITIAGQTAPGDGICLKNFPIKIGDSRDIIIRYLRFRIGDEQDCGTGCDEIDALSVRKCYNIMLDHCSLGWSIDAVLDLTVQTGYSTVQWCLLHEPLNNSKHSKGAHSYIAGWDGNSYGSYNVFAGGSYHHNLLVSGGSRTPRLDSYAGENGKRDLIDMVNNVIYNWSGYGAYGGEAADVNWQNNYHKYGPSTATRKNQIFKADDSCKMYVDGNFVYGFPDVTVNNSLGINPGDILTVDELLQDQPYEVWDIKMQPAGEAFTSVLAHAGAFVPVRDAVDKRIVNDVINHTGKIIDSQSEVGGWPVLNSVAAPADTDMDGMPDAWEDKMGLNENDAADRNNISFNGYTELELYLNSIEFQRPVQNVNYSIINGGVVLIKWDDIYLGEDSFRIEKAVNGADYTFFANVPGNSVSWLDEDFQPAKGVNYRVIAVQAGIAETLPNLKVEATGLELLLNDTVYAGDTVNIIALFEPSVATNQLIKWELEAQPEGIASINHSGRLVTTQAGEITITASSMDGGNLQAVKEVVILDHKSSVEDRNITVSEDLVTFYPNPSPDGYFNMLIPPLLTGRIKVLVMDITGEKIFEHITEKKGKVLLNHRFESGIYLVKIENGNLKSFQKVIACK